MQRTIYECDECKIEIGGQPHLSLAIGSNGHASGIAFPSKDSHTGWKTKGFKTNFLHLHPKCIAPFFKKMVEDTKNPPSKK